MAAPVVTRPPATVEEQPQSAAPAWASDFAQYAKWIVLAAVVVAVIAIVTVVSATVAENSRVSRVRTHWDEVFSALQAKEKQKEKENPGAKPEELSLTPEEERVVLEGVAEKVKGSPAHAYVLQRLGDAYFDAAMNPIKSPEERAKSLSVAVATYKTLAEQEPFKSNNLFGPLGVQNLALAYEQQQDYDKAIALLEERLPKLVDHPMYFKMSAQLGRVYWLKGSKDNDPKLKTAAREKLTDILRAAGDKSEGGAWREQAEYIKSLTDPRGKALPEGVAIPPVKKPEEKKAEAEPAKADEKKEAPKTDAKPADKKDEKKDEKKEEPKKTGSLNETPAKAGVSVSGGGSGHVSFKQMMEMAKSGRMSFCACARCAITGEPLQPGAFGPATFE